MNLYLVRHGEASQQAERPLTEKGRAEIERVSQWARSAGVRPHEIWHSGKLRAQQTAEILARHVEPPGRIVAKEGLSPNDPVPPVIELLTDDLMIVGHLPFLQNLATMLLTGREAPHAVDFATGAILLLHRDAGSWRVGWLVAPELLRTASG